LDLGSFFEKLRENWREKGNSAPAFSRGGGGEDSSTPRQKYPQKEEEKTDSSASFRCIREERGVCKKRERRDGELLTPP